MVEDREEYTAVGNDGRLRLKATAYDHRGDVDDVDDLVVDVPPGGRVVLTSLKRQIEPSNVDSSEST